jgi:hypothetical protein
MRVELGITRVVRNGASFFHVTKIRVRQGRGWHFQSGIGKELDKSCQFSSIEFQPAFGPAAGLINAAPPESARCATEWWAIRLGFRPQIVPTPFAMRSCQSKFCLTMP